MNYEEMNHKEMDRDMLTFFLYALYTLLKEKGVSGEEINNHIDKILKESEGNDVDEGAHA